MPTHWSESKEERRKFRFWNTAPPDARRDARKHGGAHFDRVMHAVLMPDSPMPVGPHAEKTMRQVPVDYLAWVQAQPWAAAWVPWRPVADYLDRHPVGPDPDCPPHVVYVSQMQACTPTSEWTWPEHALLTCHPDIDLHGDKFHTFAQGALGLRPAWYNHDLRAYRLTSRRRWMAIQAGAFEIPSSAKRAPAEFRRIHPDGKITCTKHCYADAKQAQTVINDRMRSRHGRPEQLRSYECPKCGFWHLTHKPAHENQ